jgi:hypothetical protein
MQLLLSAIVALLVWPLAAWDPSNDQVEVSVAGEVLERGESTSTSGLPPTTAVGAVEASTTTTSPPREEPAPAATPTTTEPPPPPRSSTTTSTTTATSTTTTTAPPVKPAPVPPQSRSQVFPGVQLTLAAAAPSAGAVRTADFRLDVEFGDARVLRAVRFDFGDLTADDAAVLLWGCRDPAAPNPYVLSGPTHLYAAAGSYPVTVTVRTAPCVFGSDETLPEETVQMRLTLVVP